MKILVHPRFGEVEAGFVVFEIAGEFLSYTIVTSIFLIRGAMIAVGRKLLAEGHEVAARDDFAERVDNGPEITSIAIADWAERNGVELEFIKPGRPMQNGYIERFNRTYREAVLDMYIFESLDQVRDLTAAWIDFYNRRRPHDSLGGSPPRSSCEQFSQKLNPGTPL